MNAELEHFLKELKKHVTVKEPTLFAVGGRGYYENPASDLLAFFLNPKREHRLGDLFLTTYLECMGADNPQLNTKIDVEVRSQVQTSKGKFIDLQILGLDWCLIIENKINHWDTNPFTDYERHANGLGKEKKHLSILSRDGHPYDNKDSGTRWVGVSYQDYCKALRERMAAIFFDRPFSKWQIFAREFILHLENELYNPPMTKEQAADVEKYSNQIAEAEKLAKQYREFIYQELKLLLEKSVSGNITIREDTTWVGYWLVFRCASSQWGNSQIVLYKPEGAGKKFAIRVYLENLSEQQLSDAKHALAHMKEPVNGYWDLPTDYDSSKEAIAKLCEQAKIVNNLFNKSDSTPRIA